MDISVVIPTYNGKKHLEELLPSLDRALEGIPSSEIVIVDNHSTDGTEEYIAQTYPQIVFEPLPDNYGFTKAVNHGAHKAKGRLILMLNNDCFLTKTAINQMSTFLHNYPEYIATQPIVYKQNNTIENIGFTLDLTRAYALPVTHTHFLKGKLYKDSLHARSRQQVFQQNYLYGLSATCLLIHKDIFMDIGLFDESFHSYLEDVDLFLRLALSGYQYAPCLEAHCTHKHMGTSSKMGYYKEMRDLANWIRIIGKNYPRDYIVRHGFSLMIERTKNISGLVKKMVQLNLKR